MIFGKRNQQNTRGFEYKPRFWDEKKEEFESRVADAEREYHGKSDEDYVPNRNFKFRGGKPAGGTRDPRFDTNYGKVNPGRLISLIVILAAIVFFMLYM